MSTVRVPGPLTRLVRRHGFTRSSLRRSTDRVEAGVTAALAVLAVLAVLLATVVAMSTYHRAQTEAATKAAQQTSVTAILLTDAAVPFTDSFEQGVADQATALARWQLPNGQQRTAPLWVSAERHAGDRLSIWIDQHGNRVDPPETPGLMVANAVAYGVAVLAGGWVLLGLLWWAVYRVLGRINAVWWDLDWARTGPGWSRRTSQ
ncbi:MAG: Rv1733c family protein [Pseudonocardiaceae bacterium]